MQKLVRPNGIVIHTERLEDYQIDTDADCFSVGTGGNCGFECPVFLNGYCEASENVIGSDYIDSYFPPNVVSEIKDLYSGSR